MLLSIAPIIESNISSIALPNTLAAYKVIHLRATIYSSLSFAHGLTNEHLKFLSGGSSNPSISSIDR